MKVDFRKIKTYTFDGKESEWDISKELANTIYANEQVGIVKRYVSEGFKAFVQEGVNKMLETNKE